MKKIPLLIAFLISAIISYCQAKPPFPNNQSISNAATLYHAKGGMTGDLGVVNGRYADTTAANLSYIAGHPGAQIVTGNTLWVRDSTATKWLVGSGASGSIPAGVITTIPVVGTNPGTNLSTGDWITNTFYGSQPPTAILTGGVTLELQSAATLNYTLNWTSGRQAATNPLSTIVVAGVNQTFTQPAQSASVSGTQAVSFAANTNVTYSNVTTTDDGKSATATTTFSFLPKRYYGWISDTTGIGSGSFDDAIITALGSELSASKSKSFSTGSPTGTQFLVYAYFSTAGALTQFDMNGFPSIDAMNSATRNFTNASGYTGEWIIYWSKNGQTLSSTVIAN
jgi:hypothetical protein